MRLDVGHDLPSDIRDDECLDKAEASRIEFDGKKTQVEVD